MQWALLSCSTHQYPQGSCFYCSSQLQVQFADQLRPKGSFYQSCAFPQFYLRATHTSEHLTQYSSSQKHSNTFQKLLTAQDFATFLFPFRPVLAQVHVCKRAAESSCTPCTQKSTRTSGLVLVTCLSTWNSECTSTCTLGKSHPVKG